MQFHDTSLHCSLRGGERQQGKGEEGKEREKRNGTKGKDEEEMVK